MSTSSLTVAPDGTVSCSDSDPAAAQAAAKNLTVIEAAWRAAMWGKPAGHGINGPNFVQPPRPMSAIGG